MASELLVTVQWLVPHAPYRHPGNSTAARHKGCWDIVRLEQAERGCTLGNGTDVLLFLFEVSQECSDSPDGWRPQERLSPFPQVSHARSAPRILETATRRLKEDKRSRQAGSPSAGVGCHLRVLREASCRRSSGVN
ncbi:hypothetical protein AAFF_G00230470 [Aldrovandia affinis]|uniref:Uncharacterized protein n=1 Tax=Aldrovandia affinis TaxID=143900 RepID=A0AAD7RFJ6_9TELE|nr:hypothetical protein AAFF_G00230470 [Aldrovandia affinis]